MTIAPRIQTPDLLDEDDVDRSLRPRRLEDFVGQSNRSRSSSRSRSPPRARATSRSTTCCSPARPASARRRSRRSSPPSSARRSCRRPGPTLERKADIAAFLTALEPRSVFFVDEIHRLQRALEETFYPAMEDRQLPITVGLGAGARVVTLDLPPFTLIGATTRTGLLTAPLRDRFGLQHRLEHYGIDDLATIVERSARILEVDARSRGRAGDRRAQPRHAARRQPAPQARARLRRGALRRRRHRRGRRRGARPDGDRRPRPGPPRSRVAARALPEVRRRPGRPLDARRHGGRGAGHDRGRLRAVPAAVRAAQADPRGRAATKRAYEHIGLAPPDDAPDSLF